MAYLHCHTKNCHWSQDDFWDKYYNPVNFNQDMHWFQDLMIEKLYFDISFFRENLLIPMHIDDKGKTYCTGTDYVAWELERRAKRIRKMLVKTYDEFKAKKDQLKCPICGQQNWDID